MRRILIGQPMLSIISAGHLVAFVAFGLAPGLSQTFFYAALHGGGFRSSCNETYEHFRLRPITLWGLTLWGVAHMAGGLLSVGGDVL